MWHGPRRSSDELSRTEAATEEFTRSIFFSAFEYILWRHNRFIQVHKMKRQRSRPKQFTTILIAAAGAIILTNACNLASVNRVPSAGDVQSWEEVQSFIVAESELTGVYQNTDVDAVIFTYRTKLPESEFLKQLAQRAEVAGWSLTAATSVQIYERFSPRKSNTGFFGSE